MVRIAREHDTLLFNDFVYGEMAFGDAPPSLLSIPHASEVAVESYSLSKAYLVPGWRVGALLGCARVLRLFSRLKSHLDYGHFLPIQYAASAALSAKEDLVRGTVERYGLRAQVLTSALRRAGWMVEIPSAGASVWAKPPQESSIAGEFCRDLLKQQAVLTMPGMLFGGEYADWYDSPW